MADEPVDERPRRRLFGRRRVEPDQRVEHPGTEAVVGENPSPIADAEVEVSDLSENPPSAPAPVASAPTEEQSEPESHVEPEPESEPEPGPERESEGAMTAASTDAPTTIEPAPGPPAPAQPAPAEPAPSPLVTTAPAAPESAGAADAGPGPLPMPRVIAIANQKGGVGKTTTAVNLGAALAEGGFRVLVVDLDPQGNASTGLGINPRDVESSVYDVIMAEAPVLDSVEPTTLKNLFVLPAKIDLAGADIELVATFSRELKLRRALDPVREEYDVILIDCPPSLGLLTVNGLAAADDVIVPVQSEYYALEGLGQLLKNVAMIRSVNPTLDVRGIVLTMHDSRTKLAEQVELEVREHFGARVYKTVVPRTIRIAEAPSFGQPIIVFDPTSRGAKAYRELAKEVSGGATRRTG
jgi:chromosome partitioning protein